MMKKEDKTDDNEQEVKKREGKKVSNEEEDL